MSFLENYIRELRDIRSTGAAVKEESYYTPLANLLNEVGNTLSPRVKCVLQLANRGAGHPDGGLFTQEQVRRADDKIPLLGQSPNRGVIEVKPTSDDAFVTADSRQVSKYWNRYRQVLVTNYRDYVLVGQDDNGNPVKLETYRLAKDESEFWAKATLPRAFAQQHEESLTEYLRRVMLHAAPLTAPKDLAWFLASYARTAKARIEGQELPALDSLRAALEEALGLKFEGEKGDHFFRSTLIQTLFYGVFSAWVLWAKELTPDSKDMFDWRTAAWTLRVPMIRSLFEQIATPSRLGPLGLVEVLDWTAMTLNRIDRAEFFSQFDEGQAVQYFYEPFLAAFDPELRKELGVWFTPPEIVRYMVERVDTVLREELDLPDGLADPQVYVLDPCVGTGSYLVEVLRRIEKTLKAKGEDALVASDLKQAAINRVFGFEILPAPFVVAHLQLGLLLQNLGSPLGYAPDGKDERVGVYLTNALTGWEPLDPEKEKAFQGRLTGFPELLDERDQAGNVKQQVPILVILGNPPYNAFAGVSSAEEEGIVDTYKVGLNTPVNQGGWGIRKFNLDDFYVRFFRLAERRIAEQLGRGVVCFISNFSYLSDPSFVVMRQRFLSEFDKLWFDSMNGDSRETGKRTPDGKPDPSVFSTEYNRAGIRVGTTIGLMVRKTNTSKQPSVYFRQFWGATKREDLFKSLDNQDFYVQYQHVKPVKSNRYSFRAQKVDAQYLEWPKLVELCAEQFVGLEELRGGALFDIDRAALEDRMKAYYDPKIDWETLTTLDSGLTADTSGFNARRVRDKALANEQYNSANVRYYAVHPFDIRWCYHSNVAGLWNRPRPTLAVQCWHGNKLLISRFHVQANPEGVPMWLSNGLFDKQTISRNPGAFPIRLSISALPQSDSKQSSFLSEDVPPTANLSSNARTYLTEVGVLDYDSNAKTVGLVWMHALAIGYSPSYLTENTEGNRQDWPRVPLPMSKEVLGSSAGLGEEIAALLDTENQIPGVTVGTVRPELTAIGPINRRGGGPLQEKELTVTAGWGHAGQNGIVMPGKGKVTERDYTPQEREAVEAGAKQLGMSLEEALAQLGERTYDVYLNDVAYWRNVPLKVWEYVIGGYQVMKKWLSYREQDLLGRPLTNAEVREVRDMGRRIAAILLLQPSLDENYRKCKENTYPWPGA